MKTVPSFCGTEGNYDQDVGIKQLYLRLSSIHFIFAEKVIVIMGAFRGGQPELRPRLFA